MMRFGQSCLTCGHGDVSHYSYGRKPCSMFRCDCSRFVMPGELPVAGSPIVFGIHRIPPSEAATAPAWKLPTEAQLQARHVQRLRAWARSHGHIVS